MLMAMAERTGRAMSHMAPEVKIVHARLEAWGKWAHEVLRPWPERTWLGKLCDGELGRSENRAPVTMPDHVAAVDAAVSSLGEIDRQVIKAYYCHSDPIELMARRCRMREAQFKNVLKRARWRLIGYLDGAGRGKV